MLTIRGCGSGYPCTLPGIGASLPILPLARAARSAQEDHLLAYGLLAAVGFVLFLIYLRKRRRLMRQR